MSKLVTFVATAKGFYGGHIIDPINEDQGEFLAPEDFSAKWAHRKGEKPREDQKTSAHKGPFTDLLAKKPQEIVQALKALDDKQVQQVLDAEGSQPAPRRALIAKLQDEVANRRQRAADEAAAAQAKSGKDPLLA